MSLFSYTLIGDSYEEIFVVDFMFDFIYTI